MSIPKLPKVHIDNALLSWCHRELAYWRAAGPNGRKTLASLREINKTRKTAFLLEIANGTVNICDKPEFYTRAELDDRSLSGTIERIIDYKDFIGAALNLENAKIRTSILVDVNDKALLRHDAPVFGFQKERNSPTILLPDIDFLRGTLYQLDHYRDLIPYRDKAVSAFFAGATTGVGQITEKSVRNLTVPRIRAAVHFKDNPDVTFRLPNIVACDSPETEELIRSLGISGTHIPISEQYNHRFLISMDGYGATCQRVALALKSNGVLLKYESPHMLYYFDRMIPWVHYIPIFDDKDVDNIIRIEKNEPGTFEFISRESGAFYNQYLSPSMIQKYAVKLLLMYQDIFSTPSHRRTSIDDPARRNVWYEPISLAGLEKHPELRIDDKPVALPSDNLLRRGLAVPPLAFGVTGGSAESYVQTHAGAPAWLLRNVMVHGSSGLITTAGYVIETTLNAERLHLIPGAMQDEDGWVRLPEREPLANVHTAFHLLDFRTDDYAHWLLDMCARFGPDAVKALLSHQGASRAPVVLVPPLDKFWKWESLDLFVPETTARLALHELGDVFVQRLLYVPGLSGGAWATHPSTGPIFDAIRDRIAGPASNPSGRGRRVFIDGPASAPGNLAELAAVAERAEFARAAPGELPIWHQVRLFAEASHVIGAHGADLAGLVFCRPGTAVLELRPDGGTPWTWRHLAAMRGLRYGCLEGAEIDPDAFDALLKDERFAWS